MRKLKLLDLIFGGTHFEVPADMTEECLNKLHVSKLAAYNYEKSDEKFSFDVRRKRANKVKAVLDKSGIKVYSIRGRGLPFLVKRYRRRWGIAVGVLLFCGLLWTSKNYVWQIEYSGNENVSDMQIEKQLMDLGFGVGSYLPDVDFYTLCNNFLKNSRDISYISVNMEGTTAKVQVRELYGKPEDDGIKASNLVAKYSGQIDSMTVYSGKTVVERDSVVKEGELLVSGFHEKTFGFDIVRSTGNVYAYVTRIFETEVSFEQKVKEYTGNVSRDREIEFFGRSLFLPSKGNGSFECFDENIDRERVVLFDRVRLPLILTETERLEYTERTVTLNEEEAKKNAEMQLTQLLARELADSDILERRVREEITDTSYKLICEIYCLTDIAVEKEILLN